MHKHIQIDQLRAIAVAIAIAIDGGASAGCWRSKIIIKIVLPFKKW